MGRKPKISPHIHPLVREFFSLIEAQHRLHKEIIATAGLSENTIYHWTRRYNPSLPGFVAALNSLGYELVIKKIGEKK